MHGRRPANKCTATASKTSGCGASHRTPGLHLQPFPEGHQLPTQKAQTVTPTSSWSRCAAPPCYAPCPAYSPAPVRSSCFSPSPHPLARAPGAAQHLLHESRLIRDPAQAGAVHEVLLIRYAAATHRALLAHHARPAQTPTRPQRTSASDKADDVEARLARVRRIATAYKPSARVWAAVFAQETHAPDAGGEEDEGDAEEGLAAGDAAGAAGVAAPGAPGGASGAGYFGDASVVRAVYEQWRRCDGVEATTGWATWLLRRGEGREAIAVVARARSALGDADGLEVERRWKTVLDGEA